MNKSNGYLNLIIGPMFSGKSTKLIQYIKKYKTLNKKLMVIKPSLDNRYTELSDICTHDMQTQNCIMIDKDKLSEIITDKDYLQTDIIMIEEGQFFTNLYLNIIQMLNDNKTIFISALNGDSNQELFGEIYKLISICDNIEFLQALCLDCADGTPAIFSKRLSSNQDQILVAGADEYKAVCRYHNSILD
jgi:thymidine kinase